MRRGSELNRAAFFPRPADCLKEVRKTTPATISCGPGFFQNGEIPVFCAEYCFVCKKTDKIQKSGPLKNLNCKRFHNDTDMSGMAPKPPKTYILCLHICDHRSILLDEQKTLNRIQKARQQHLCDSPDLPLSDTGLYPSEIFIDGFFR